MSVYVQYHNVAKEGLAPLFSNDDRFAIYTRRPHVRQAIGGTVYLIAGIGKPKQYFLWEAFRIEKVRAHRDGTYVANGPGWRLSPPQQLEGAAFDEFKRSCANLIGFCRIDDLPYKATLQKLADRSRRANSAGTTISFLHGLLDSLRDGTQDHQVVLAELQRLNGSPRADSRTARSNGRPRRSISTPRAAESATRSANVTSSASSRADKHLRALSIRQPHAEAILRGIKKIEYRSIPTRIRGRVQIYASLGRDSAEAESKYLDKYGIDDVAADDLPRGVLVGTVEIFNCTEDFGEFHWHLAKPQRAAKLLKPVKQPQPVWFNPF